MKKICATLRTSLPHVQAWSPRTLAATQSASSTSQPKITFIGTGPSIFMIPNIHLARYALYIGASAALALGIRSTTMRIETGGHISKRQPGAKCLPNRTPVGKLMPLIFFTSPSLLKSSVFSLVLKYSAANRPYMPPCSKLANVEIKASLKAFLTSLISTSPRIATSSSRQSRADNDTLCK